MSAHNTNETALVKACLQLLQLRGWHAWRNNTGGRPWTDARGKPRLMRFGCKGSGDIFAIRDGVFLSVEAKMPGKHPTEDQLAWMDLVNRNGGVGCVVRSVDDLQTVLERINS